LNSTFDREASLQNMARKWRRKECLDIIKSIENDNYQSYVATAHHKDDQIETLLLKLFRGVHISNFQPVGYCVSQILGLSHYVAIIINR